MSREADPVSAELEAVDGGGETTEPARPLLRVVRGDPTDEEVAALTAVIAAVAASNVPAKPEPRLSAWRDPAVRMRRELRPGPTAWRSSAFLR